MNTKQTGAEKSAYVEQYGEVQASRSSSQASSRNYLIWISTAVLLAGASYLLTTKNISSGAQSSSAALPAALPESYGLCTEPGRIYTVDENKPTVECIVIRKDEVLAIGTRCKRNPLELYYLLTFPP